MYTSRADEIEHLNPLEGQESKYTEDEQDPPKEQVRLPPLDVVEGEDDHNRNVS